VSPSTHRPWGRPPYSKKDRTLKPLRRHRRIILPDNQTVIRVVRQNRQKKSNLTIKKEKQHTMQAKNKGSKRYQSSSTISSK
jgi:hypothetical protein